MLTKYQGSKEREALNCNRAISENFLFDIDNKLTNKNTNKMEGKMKKINLIGLAVVVISGLLLLSNAYAETLTVPTQYPTIQAAIDAANPGDTVMVLPGTYEIDEQINVDKDLTIKSEGGPENTTLLATTNLNYNEYVFLIMLGTTSATTIEGFTISPTTLDNMSYSGIGCWTNTSPTITNNVIQGRVINNQGTIIGTGINIFPNASPIINNNIISRFGFGVDFAYDSSAEIENCTIVYNVSAGIMSANPQVSLKNSIVYFNGSLYVPFGSMNIILGVPGTVTYSDIGGTSLYPGMGNINADPLFVDVTNNDYHLQTGSLCIDAGDPNPIYNDPDGTRNDMGAYGGPGASYGNVNRAPIIGREFVVFAGQPGVINVYAVDPEGDPITLTVDAQGNRIEFVDHGNGTGTLTFLTNAGMANNTYRFTLTASDGEASSTSPIVIKVLPQ